MRHGLKHHEPLPMNLAEYPETLREKAASFVTLTIYNELRGCIGTLEAYQPLVTDVSERAFCAAFRDPRFPPLSAGELPHLHYHISILSEATSMQFESEADLLRQLRPGVDGLILEDGPHRGTFLPSVWDSLPQTKEFLRHLKLKAGLQPDYWSPTLRIERYTTESF